MKQQIIMHKKTASGYDEIYPDTSIDNILTNQTIADNIGVSDIDAQTVLESVSATDKMISGYGTTSGTASAYVVNLVGKETMTPVDGMMIKVKFHVDSNEEPTINVNGSGAKNIFTENGLKVLGTIKTGAWVLLIKSDALDGWVLQGLCKRNKMYTEIITSSQSWTPPDGVKMVTVRLFGGGGGGGGGYTLSGGAGGGGGEMAAQTLQVVPLTVYPITIGAGGKGGTERNDGSAGGVTSFGTLLSANGGSGGVGRRSGSGSSQYNSADGGSGGSGGGAGGGNGGDGSGGSGSYGGNGGSNGNNGSNGIAVDGGEGKGGSKSTHHNAYGAGGGGGYGGNGGDADSVASYSWAGAGGGGGGGGGYGTAGNGGGGGMGGCDGGNGGIGAGGGGGGGSAYTDASGGTGGKGGNGVCIITYWKYE